MELLHFLWIYLIAINVFTFSLYGIDKRKAKLNRWRIPESTLLGAAFIGGSVGAFAGMQLFRHKTRHKIFQIMVPLFLVLHIILFILLITNFF